jgi:hypothetical protein
MMVIESIIGIVCASVVPTRVRSLGVRMYAQAFQTLDSPD